MVEPTDQGKVDGRQRVRDLSNCLNENALIKIDPLNLWAESEKVKVSVFWSCWTWERAGDLVLILLSADIVNCFSFVGWSCRALYSSCFLVFILKVHGYILLCVGEAHFVCICVKARGQPQCHSSGTVFLVLEVEIGLVWFGICCFEGWSHRPGTPE